MQNKNAALKIFKAASQEPYYSVVSTVQFATSHSHHQRAVWLIEFEPLKLIETITTETDGDVNLKPVYCRRVSSTMSFRLAVTIKPGRREVTSMILSAGWPFSPNGILGM